MKHPAKVEEAVERFESGQPVALVHHASPEAEGAIVAAADRASQGSLAFLDTHTLPTGEVGGLRMLSVALPVERVLELRIPAALPVNGGLPSRFPEWVPRMPVGLRQAVAPGADPRLAIVHALADSATGAERLAFPGLVQAIAARSRGLGVVPEIPEAALELCRLAGAAPAALVGRAAAAAESLPPEIPLLVLEDLASQLGTPRREVEYRASARLPTRYGEFQCRLYEDRRHGLEHVALVLGDVADGESVLVRAHSECFTGDVMTSLRCDCGPQLHLALERIGEEGRGVLLYLRQEGRGIGLRNKLRAYELQDTGLDTVEANERLGFPADMREYSSAAHMLLDLGVREIRLLTNNPGKLAGFERYGVTLRERVPLIIRPEPENQAYLATKKEKMGHLFSLLDTPTVRGDR